MLFAKTFAQQNANARKYGTALNKLKVHKSAAEVALPAPRMPRSVVSNDLLAIEQLVELAILPWRRFIQIPHKF